MPMEALKNFNDNFDINLDHNIQIFFPVNFTAFC